MLGDIHRYWTVLLLGDIFHCDTQYDTNQTAVSTVYLITVLTSAVRPLSACVAGRVGRGKVQAIQWSARVIDGRKGVGLNDATIQSNSLSDGAILHTSISIGIGYWYR